MNTLAQGEYYSGTESQTKFKKFILTKKVHSKGESLPNHLHNNAYITNVIRGSFSEKYDHKERQCCPNTVIYHPPYEKHSDKFYEDGFLFNIEIEKSYFEDLLNQYPTLDIPADCSYNKISALFNKIYYESINNDDFSEITISGLLEEIFSLINKNNNIPDISSYPYWLILVKEILHEERVSNISLEKISKEINIHPVHISRSFRKYFGITPGEYLRKLKAKNACIMIKEKKYPLSKVAVETGFYDQAHFTKIFKKIVGLTPLQYSKIS